MVNKKSKSFKKKIKKNTSSVKVSSDNIETLKLMTDHEIAMDFACKLYKKFDKIIKSVVLFGSVEKQNVSKNSDIDIVIIIDDVSVNWNQEVIVWYREGLELLLKSNPYKGNLHINTIKLSSWWDDLLKGEPVVLNILRNGQVMLDNAGFIEPLKLLLIQGKIKGTPESIYECLQRAPTHIARSKAAELAAIDGIYWSMVDAAHAALIAAGDFPPSPEYVINDLKEFFANKGLLKIKYVVWYKDIYELHKKIDHREITDLKGVEIDLWQNRAEEFLNVMIQLVKKIISEKL